MLSKRAKRVLTMAVIVTVVIGLIVGFYWLLAIALVKIFPVLEGKELWLFLIVAAILTCLGNKK